MLFFQGIHGNGKSQQRASLCCTRSTYTMVYYCKSWAILLTFFIHHGSLCSLCPRALLFRLCTLCAHRFTQEGWHTHMEVYTLCKQINSVGSAHSHGSAHFVSTVSHRWDCILCIWQWTLQVKKLRYNCFILEAHDKLHDLTHIALESIMS